MKTKVLAFEPDPRNLEKCRQTLDSLDRLGSEVILDSRCLTDTTGPVQFLAIDHAIYDNPGAGSLLPLTFSNRPESDPDRNRGLVQRPIRVEGVRYDECGYASPDSIFMDVQGADLLVLQGFGELLREVSTVTLETSLVSTYEGGCTFPNIEAFLRPFGFTYVASTRYGFMRPPTVSVPSDWQGDFDVLFARPSRTRFQLALSLLRKAL